MASSTPLKDLKENFFLCPVCLEQFQEPKLLPCLHRYCSNCLGTVVNTSNNGKIKCPMCKQEWAIPQNGIDGFQTDFYVKGVVDFIQKSFEQNPSCRTHVEENAQLCCSTCVNEPICVICTYSEHKGHDLNDVTELAKTERELLESKLAELQKLESQLYQLPKNVEATKQKLKENVSMKTDILINQHKHQVRKIKHQLEERRNERVQGLREIEKRREDEEKQTNCNYEGEINKLNKKYDKIRKATERKYNNECTQFNDCCDTLESELDSKLERLDIHLKSLTDSQNLLTENHNMALGEITFNCDQLIEWYENFITNASSILTAKDKWAQVQLIPDIRAACEPLLEEMKKEYPELDTLSDIYISDMPVLVVGDVTISQQSVVDVEGLKAMGGKIDSVTRGRNGNIVISGFVSFQYSHITVINRKGKIQRQDQIKKEKGNNVSPCRYCCYLSEFKVATVCAPDEIGIYDVRDGSYESKYIRDVIPNWKLNRLAWCIANDPVKNHIIVGTNSRYVYAFDDQLNYIHTITLPNIINRVNDITAHAGTLLICDYVGKRAYAVNMKGSEIKLMYEFTKPYVDGSNVGPYRVCTDKNDSIYILWRVYFSDQLTYTLGHYRQDGRHLMTTRNVDNDAYCLTTMEVGESERLLLLTYSSGKLYEYVITSSSE